MKTRSPWKLGRRLALPAVVVCIPLILFGRSAYRSHLRDRLFEAIDRGDVEAARGLLDRGADPNAIDRSAQSGFRGFPVLTRAVCQERTEIVQALLAKGANPNEGGSDRYTALGYAVMFRKPALVRALIDHGADANRAALTNMNPPQPEIYRLLRDHGAHVTLADAVRHDDVETVVQQLESGADPNIRRPNDGNTLLCVAAGSGSIAVVKALLKRGADPNGTNVNGNTPLLAAIFGRSVPAIEALVAAGAKVNSTFQKKPLLYYARLQIRLIAKQSEANAPMLRGTPALEAIRQARGVVAFLEGHGAHE